MQWFRTHNSGFQLLAWSLNYPYLSPIEHLCYVLEKQVQSMGAQPLDFQGPKRSATDGLVKDVTP